METKTINLRDMPIDLVRQAKAYAALRGMTLKDFVIHAICNALEGDIPAMANAINTFGVAGKGKKKRKVK